MATGKATRGTRANLPASVADLGSVVRLNPNNFNPFSFSLVLDEFLQLIEAPVANPIIKPFSSPLLSYAFEIFHNDFVSIKAGNNLLTYAVVYPSHITSFPTTKLFQQSLSRPCAFSLKFSTNELKLPFNLLDLMRIEKLAVGSGINRGWQFLSTLKCGVSLPYEL